MLILFAWGRCWNLSLEAHLFISNSGSEPGLPQTALLLRKQPWVYFCCCCFGFIVCWFVGFNSTWTDHLVSDVGFRKLIPSPDLGKAFNKGELSRLPEQWVPRRPGDRQRVWILLQQKNNKPFIFLYLQLCPSMLTKAVAIFALNGLEQKSAFSWNRF